MYGPKTAPTGWAGGERGIVTRVGAPTATTGSPWGTQWSEPRTGGLTLAQARELVAALAALGLSTHTPEEELALAAARCPSTPVELRAVVASAPQRVRPRAAGCVPRARRPHARGQGPR